MIIVNSVLRASLAIYHLISNAHSWKNYYFSFKIFSRFWLVKTAQFFNIISFLWINLERPFSYWANGVKSVVVLNKWCQKCNPLQVIKPLIEKIWGRDSVIFGEQKNKERNGEIKNGEMCYPPRPSGYILLDLQNSSYPTKASLWDPEFNNC